MASQLRIYDIRPGLMDEFVAEFQRKIAPPRLQYDFQIDGPWVTADRTQFVWIVSYTGPLDWQAAVDRYYHSPERSSIDFNPDDYIESMDVRMLYSV